VCQTNDEEKVFGVQEYLGHFGDPRERERRVCGGQVNGHDSAAAAIAAGADHNEWNGGIGFGTADVVVAAAVVHNGVEQAWEADPDDGVHERGDERRWSFLSLRGS